MRIQDHLPKLSWVAADKLLFVLYGIVALLQIRALPPAEYGLYALLVSIQTWVFVMADGLVLQGLIQFGTDRRERPAVNAAVAVLYVSTIAALVAIIIALEPSLRTLFGEERFRDVARLEAIFCLLTIPRAYCLRLLQRDIQPRQIFWIDAAWLGPMSLATVQGIWQGWLHNFQSLAAIAIGGIGISSAVALVVARSLLVMRLERWGSVARRVLSFGMGQMSASILHTSIRQLDVVIAQSFFGTAAVGVYQAAKTIYRFFELGMDAATSIVYPAAVTYYHSRQQHALYATVSKGLSVVFVVFVGGCGAIWLGADAVGAVLGARYASASMVLRLLSVAACAMPLALTGVVLVAVGRIATHTAITVLATIAAVAWFIVTGLYSTPMLFPLGVAVYYAVLGTGDWLALRRSGVVALTLRDLLRSIGDGIAAVRQRRNQRSERNPSVPRQ